MQIEQIEEQIEEKSIMNEKTAKDSHYARLRRQHRDRQSYLKDVTKGEENVYLYGLHTVAAALANPRRKLVRLMATKNALSRLNLDARLLPIEPQICEPRQLDQLLGREAVHQGVMLETVALRPRSLSGLGACRLVVVLDQVSDPHNVGALMRSSVAFGAGAFITTARHSAQESGVLAKAASGALEKIDTIHVGNLAQALGQLHEIGFCSLGLDSGAEKVVEQAVEDIAGKYEKIALVLGNEGKGLRLKTRQSVTHLVRLDMPGSIKSLNVSNAGVLALYLASNCLKEA